MKRDIFREMEIDKLYRLGRLNERDTILSTSCQIACLAVRTHTSNGIEERQCIRCKKVNPPRLLSKKVSRYEDMQADYDNGRFSAYRDLLAPLFVGVSCFPTAHMVVTVRASASRATMLHCVRCKGGTIYTISDETRADLQARYGTGDLAREVENEMHNALMKLAPQLTRPFTGAVCMECGASQRSGVACASCGNISQSYDAVKAAFLRR